MALQHSAAYMEVALHRMDCSHHMKKCCLLPALQSPHGTPRAGFRPALPS
jgi:hypothetical protein